MYYVIKRQIGTPPSCFIGFKVPKYIASKSGENIIFEFTKDGKISRKWIKKSEIILLTDDRDFFLKTLEQFKAVQATQQKLVDAARLKFEESMETFTESIYAEIDEFEELRDSSDIPCILKNL